MVNLPRRGKKSKAIISNLFSDMFSKKYEEGARQKLEQQCGSWSLSQRYFKFSVAHLPLSSSGVEVAATMY